MKKRDRPQEKSKQAAAEEEAKVVVVENDEEESRSAPRQTAAEILQRGNIYFLFRPKVLTDHPHSLNDIQRFEIVLHPEGKDLFRLLVVGRKRLPDVSRHEKHFGFVEAVAADADELAKSFAAKDYETETRGERRQPPVWPAGEGVYALVRDEGGRNSRFCYKLELPETLGDVQHQLRIDREASYVMTVKNPKFRAPPGVGLSPSQQAQYSEDLLSRMRNLRFAPAEPAYLEYTGCEFIFIGVDEEPEAKFHIDLEAEKESVKTADLFKDFAQLKRSHPLASLLKGSFEETTERRITGQDAASAEPQAAKRDTGESAEENEEPLSKRQKTAKEQPQNTDSSSISNDQEQRKELATGSKVSARRRQ